MRLYSAKGVPLATASWPLFRASDKGSCLSDKTLELFLERKKKNDSNGKGIFFFLPTAHRFSRRFRKEPPCQFGFVFSLRFAGRTQSHWDSVHAYLDVAVLPSLRYSSSKPLSTCKKGIGFVSPRSVDVSLYLFTYQRKDKRGRDGACMFETRKHRGRQATWKGGKKPAAARREKKKKRHRPPMKREAAAFLVLFFFSLATKRRGETKTWRHTSSTALSYERNRFSFVLLVGL